MLQRQLSLLREGRRWFADTAHCCCGKCSPGMFICTRESLARPGKKKATATKLVIYSTHSPRSSIHFLAQCSNFYKPLKKIQNAVRSTRSPRQYNQRVGRKMATFQVFFQSREQVVVRRGQIRRIGWVITTPEAQIHLFTHFTQQHNLQILYTEFYSVLHTCFGSLFQPSSGRNIGSQKTVKEGTGLSLQAVG
jgi:hypothetical protein